jgi:hypothetical protein
LPPPEPKASRLQEELAQQPVRKRHDESAAVGNLPITPSIKLLDTVVVLVLRKIKDPNDLLRFDQ